MFHLQSTHIGVLAYAYVIHKLSKILVSHTMHQGNMQVPLYIMPIIREIYGSAKNEIEMRIIALEIISTKNG